MRGYDNGFDPYNHQMYEIDSKMRDLEMEREALLHRNLDKPLEPQVQTIATLAHEAGENKALYRSSDAYAKKLEKTIEERDSTIKELTTYKELYTGWRERAEKAELTLKRSRAARRK